MRAARWLLIDRAAAPADRVVSYRSAVTDTRPPGDPSTIAEADGGLVRADERLAVTTRRVPIGRAVLRKRIVVERRTITVDVAHEEVVLDHEPIDGDETDAAHGAHLALPEVVLHEEQIVVTKRIVPVERARVRVDSVQEERQVTADLHREQVDVVRDSAPARMDGTIRG